MERKRVINAKDEDGILIYEELNGEQRRWDIIR